MMTWIPDNMNKPLPSAVEAAERELRSSSLWTGEGISSMCLAEDIVQAVEPRILEMAIGTLNQAANELESAASREGISEEESSHLLGLRNGFRSLAEDWSR